VTAYPPEPWYLGGSLLVGVFLVPQPEGFELPDGRHPLRIGRRIIVGAAFVRYVPGGALSYDELLVATPSLGKGGLRFTIPQIWVDSAASRAGGRELWAIPKELETFTRTETSTEVTASMGSVASIDAHFGRRIVPGMLQLALPILQVLGGRRVLSRNRVIGRIFGLRSDWDFSPDGPLGYLSGRKPLLSVAIRDASIIFGMDVERS